MTWLLAAAAVLSAIAGEATDAIAIAAILVLNAAVGFFQELRAERAVLALRSLTAPRARVVRDGRAAVIAAAEVVPGDLLLLEAGDLIAADARIADVAALRMNEAPLTGESAPVDKSPAPVPESTPLAERADTVFMGTAVASGTGSAEVVATGMRTELGAIATLLAGAASGPTPLQKRLDRVSRTLAVACVAIVLVVGGIAISRGGEWMDVLLSSVALAVAAVPEGLSAVVTVALAIGVRRMAARNVLVRRLPSVETLGCATVICTDKTGTLTTGKMRVREVWGRDHDAVVHAAAACCDAELQEEDAGVGDPTEIAILIEAMARGITRDEIERTRPRVETCPFDSERKRMSVLRADGRLYVKGAIEVVLERCVSGTDGAKEANVELAARGLRVLAVAMGAGREEKNLTLLGLLGIADPPRTEAIEAVAIARGAGIRTVMITGDHDVTARAIAAEMGILRPGDDASEVVVARATAAQKIEVVRTLKARGEVVAMTGDGVNDAPAIREADVGIAMGITGTEVTREAADMILTDDDYASMVAAVREGRGAFENIQKTLVYLLIGNAGELALMMLAALAGLPLPLLPLHLLWINLVTDGLPALTLVMDKPAPDAMKVPPRSPSSAMLGRREWRTILAIGAFEAVAVFGVYRWALDWGVPYARDMAFTTLVFAELLRAFGARSVRLLLWEVGLLTNRRVVGAVLATGALQIAIHSFEAPRALFRLVPLSANDVLIALAVAFLPVSLLEIAKLVRRHAFPMRGP